MSIVVVDDSITNLIVLKSLCCKLCKEACRPFVNPDEALSWLAGNRADLVIVDYSMPSMNGVDFIAAVRAGPLHARTPVVMVTSSGNRAVRSKAMQAGANDFLTKPVDAVAFKKCVTKYLALSNRHKGELQAYVVPPEGRRAREPEHSCTSPRLERDQPQLTGDGAPGL